MGHVATPAAKGLELTSTETLTSIGEVCHILLHMIITNFT